MATQPRTTPDRPAQPGRPIRPRRGLPGSRAVVGALLVTVAAVGIFVAWSGADAGPSTRYVVATRRLSPGHRLSASDLRTMAMNLSGGVAGRSFSEPAALVGAVTLGPIEAGELVQSGSVLPARQSKPRPELSFGIDADRAVDGSLQPGDRIDLLVTYGSGTSSSTDLVVPAADLLSVGGGASNGLSGGRRQVLTVALPDRAAALALTNAVRAGELTVVRSTGVRDLPPRGPFQPTGSIDATTAPKDR